MARVKICGGWRSTTLLLALAALAIGAAGCGGSSSPTASTAAARSRGATPTPSGSEAVTAATHADRDRDGDFGSPDTDLPNAFGFDGHAVDASNRAAIDSLVKRYYAAALAENGAKACPLLYSTLSEAAAEDYGRPGESEYTLGAKNCPEVLTDVFRHFHAAFAAEIPRMRIVAVLVKRRQGLAVVGFGSLPRAGLPLQREGSRWRLGALRDHELP